MRRAKLVCDSCSHAGTWRRQCCVVFCLDVNYKRQTCLQFYAVVFFHGCSLLTLYNEVLVLVDVVDFVWGAWII